MQIPEIDASCTKPLGLILWFATDRHRELNSLSTTVFLGTLQKLLQLYFGVSLSPELILFDKLYSAFVLHLNETLLWIELHPLLQIQIRSHKPQRDGLWKRSLGTSLRLDRLGHKAQVFMMRVVHLEEDIRAQLGAQHTDLPVIPAFLQNLPIK